MGTVTYPDAAVNSLLAEHFVCFKLDMLDRHPDFKEACGSGRVMFAPTFIFTDGKGRELRRYLGWLPPEKFLGELQFVRATYNFNRGDLLGARDLFAEGVDRYGAADVTAEALYWQGIAGFLGGKKDLDALRSAWTDVRERFPNSTWATRAEVIDDLEK